MTDYRYALHRCVHDFQCPPASRRLLWVMMNPSTADDSQDDPTIRKCKGFTRRWGFDEMRVANLWAMRATKPADLWDALRGGRDAVGEHNDGQIVAEAMGADAIAVAWGKLPRLAEDRVRIVQRLLWENRRDRTRSVLLMIGANRDGSPKHPLMAAYTETPLEWHGVAP